MSPEELAERCAYWQRVLRIADWKIGVKYAHSYEVEHDNIGTVKIWSEEKAALVNLIYPAEYEPGPWDTVEPYDEEKTLVHELLHVLMEPHAPKKETPQHTAFEQTINLLAHALVGLDRHAEKLGEAAETLAERER